MSPLVTTHPRTTGERLTAEWARLRHRPAALRAADAWQIADHPLTDLADLLATVGYESVRTPASEDRFRRLVLHARHDELAARVAIQRILPGLLAIVRRRRHHSGNDAFDELLGAAWEAVRTFNPERRPACLAASLIADADYRAFRAPHRRKATPTSPLDDVGPLADVRQPHPADELARLFDEAIDAGIPSADIVLLRQLLAARTANELAARLDVTPRTIRNRRDRITGRLRDLTIAA